MSDNQNRIARFSELPDQAEESTQSPDQWKGPAGRTANKPLYSLHMALANGELRSFQYAHLDSDSRYNGSSIKLRFLGMKPAEVNITGRNIWQLYDTIHRHQCPWIKVATNDFAKDGEPVITGISFAEPKIEPHDLE